MEVLVKPERVERGERDVVVVVHDESIFSSNDGTSMLSVWVRGVEFPIMPKGRGRGPHLHGVRFRDELWYIFQIYFGVCDCNY
jgi:hypothetical protein